VDCRGVLVALGVGRVIGALWCRQRDAVKWVWQRHYEDRVVERVLQTGGEGFCMRLCCTLEQLPLCTASCAIHSWHCCVSAGASQLGFPRAERMCASV
jgi:hypothetical protein